MARKKRMIRRKRRKWELTIAGKQQTLFDMPSKETFKIRGFGRFPSEVFKKMLSEQEQTLFHIKKAKRIQ